MVRFVALDSLQQFVAVNLTADAGYDRGNRVIPNCAQFVIQWSQEDGRAAHNVLHASYSGPFAGSQAQATAIYTALTTGAQWTAMAAFLATNTILQNVIIRNLGLANQPDIPGLTAGAAGTSAGQALPNEVAAVVTLRTGGVGPQNRGRIYVPGFATTALGGGNVIGAGALTAIGNWASIIAGALSAQGYVFGIAHFSRLAYTGTTGTPHPARPAGVVPITTVSMRDNHWDTQRRRGLK